ncbi:thioesterase superfamily protein [Treponema primitia ZAS-2]|uniref:Thioesterase superfamily protein n=1 Tax=Treponema primitia (strain ATCC BAA-887 / DSM 12427 / ZAS-2) TaxID=545694 RepID=F5YNR1_TREPZ|nr:thioesterase family protein [Treponema primitia]AEF84695.1 thioesterase superfamily protein [Treponema primitia ZAS-2]
MFTITITPRFGEADGLGHINNTHFSEWFELARNPLFKIFSPEMSTAGGEFPLILAYADYNFLKEVHFPKEVEIRSFISRIGTKSFTSYHEAWQDGNLCVSGSAVAVYFDFIKHISMPIPDDIKKILTQHLKPEGSTQSAYPSR